LAFEVEGVKLTRFIAPSVQWAGGRYIGEWKGKRYLIWSHRGSLRWSARREGDPPMSILGQGRTLKECVAYLKAAIRAAN
jgi:hypothetical protein